MSRRNLPDVLGRVEFRAFGRQRQYGDVFGNVELGGRVPAGLIDHQHGMGAWRDALGDFSQMQVHRICVAFGQDERCALALLGRDRAENIGRGRALIFRGARTRAALRPAPRDLVLLADAGFVAEPDFYAVDVDAFFADDLLQPRREIFLNASIAPSCCA